ncbi:MAG: hypothetical protein OEW93_08855 [Candidatus Bathyarchaeota archaeon]|nr:hypothetical protein [Candidatus Bathyarchaeota archaeon]MDH5792480.1 hypothetical protein [Candidatus Bathyarchaeota archaeon]
MVESGDKERVKYGQFVDMLNALRGEDLISAQQRREFDRRWRAEKELRDQILEDLERIMERHSEYLMSKDHPPESPV